MAETRGVSEEKMTVAIWLYDQQRRAGIGRSGCRRLLQAFPAWRDLLTASAADLREVLSVHGAVPRETIPEQAVHAVRSGIGCFFLTDPGYPDRLRALASSPPVLFFRGRPACIASAASVVTVVGSRSPSPYGVDATRRITRQLAENGIPIVSGLARGIDTIAHRAALSVSGTTAAVLAGGIDCVYPPENEGLLEEIAAAGVVMSEHKPGIRPVRSGFATRNRILSGLADCVLVTQATNRSGTLITAGFAADQGRDLFALPGSIFQRQSAGCNQLLQEGALVLTGARDVLSRLESGRLSRRIQPLV